MAKQKTNYYKEQDYIKIQKTEQILMDLPGYIRPFVQDIQLSRRQATVLAYVSDLRIFFRYLKDNNPLLKNMEIKDIPESILENLTYVDINDFQNHLILTGGGDNQSKTSTKRRISALNKFFYFACTHGILSHNPMTGISSISIDNDHRITRLSKDETKSYIKTVENGTSKNHRATEHRKKYRLRDTAIIKLLLNTGIRVSECTGLDIDSINFDERSMTVFRKRGKTEILYFNEEVKEALTDYIERERPKYMETKDETALFLSNRKKRMDVQSIRNVVEKYAKEIETTYKVTPHLLRRTFGTGLYQATEDIKLVADVLGHSSIQTTSEHYTENENLRKAATINLYE